MIGPGGRSRRASEETQAKRVVAVGLRHDHAHQGGLVETHEELPGLLHRYRLRAPGARSLLLQPRERQGDLVFAEPVLAHRTIAATEHLVG